MEWLVSSNIKNCVKARIFATKNILAHLEPEQYAKDFAKLLSIRDGLKSKKKPKVFGVDNALDLPWMNEFLGNLSKNSNSTIDAFTWHRLRS